MKLIFNPSFIMLFTTYLYVLSMSSLCAPVYVSVNCTRFAQLLVVDVRLYKGGAAEIFRFELLIVPRSDPSVSKVVQQLGFVVQ